MKLRIKFHVEKKIVFLAFVVKIHRSVKLNLTKENHFLNNDIAKQV